MAVAATVSLLYTLIYSSFAYILPGYQTFKAIERRGTEDVRQWAVYWVSRGLISTALLRLLVEHVAA